MADGKIFKTKLADKNNYFNLVIPFLTDAANITRLGLSAVPELSDAATLYTGTWLPVYPISINPATSTKTHRQTRNACWKSMEAKLRIVYDEIPASALTLSDRNTLNLKLREPASPRPQIDSIPFAKLVNIGGGRIREIVRTNNDDNRASIHPDANGVETVYVITAADAAPPASPAACPNKVIITKPRFEIECGIENLGKRVYGFSRWINLNDTAKSGPYSDFFTTVLGGSGEE